MHIQSLALLVSEEPISVALVSQAVARTELFRVQIIDKIATAVARTAGGGVQVVFFELQENELWNDGLRRIREAAPEVPVIVLSDRNTETLALQAIRTGAAGSVRKDDPKQDPESVITALLMRISDGGLEKASAPYERRATLIAFTGAKGGVGCTTVALNVAATLARRHRVILAELKCEPSFLRQYLRPQRPARGLAAALTSQTFAESSFEIESSLWASRSIPNLHVLFGPQSAQESRALDVHCAKKLVATLGRSADYVIFDLQPSYADVSRTVLRESDLMGLVLERDPLCIDYAKAALPGLNAAGVTPQESGVVVVNRAAFGCPIPLSEIELTLGMSILGVVPPGPDLCLSAQKAHSPVVTFDPESLMARNFANLAERVSTRHPQ